MNAWWDVGLTLGRTGERSENRSFANKFRSSAVTCHLAGLCKAQTSSTRPSNANPKAELEQRAGSQSWSHTRGLNRFDGTCLITEPCNRPSHRIQPSTTSIRITSIMQNGRMRMRLKKQNCSSVVTRFKNCSRAIISASTMWLLKSRKLVEAFIVYKRQLGRWPALPTRRRAPICPAMKTNQRSRFFWDRAWGGRLKSPGTINLTIYQSAVVDKQKISTLKTNQKKCHLAAAESRGDPSKLKRKFPLTAAVEARGKKLMKMIFL